MTQEQYDQKKQARIDRLEAAADKAQATGSALVDSARKMASVIPLGQPILIGHHSEKRDRAYRGRIESRFRKGFSEMDKAAYYQRRAEAAASNKAIFSDDPLAAEKIEEKIARLQKRQDLMRAANKAIRKGDDEALKDLGFSEEAIARLKTPDFCGRIGYPDYALTNNNANIRRLAKRLASVKENAGREHKEYSIGAFRIVENPDENRVQLFFSKDLLPKVKEALKGNGFHFSLENTCWQRQLNAAAVWHADQIAGSQRAHYEAATETIRSLPENWCLAAKVGGKWEAFRVEGATTQWHDAIQKVIDSSYWPNEAGLAAQLGACLKQACD